METKSEFIKYFDDQEKSYYILNHMVERGFDFSLWNQKHIVFQITKEALRYCVSAFKNQKHSNVIYRKYFKTLEEI